jgi:hypothetical protein
MFPLRRNGPYYLPWADLQSVLERWRGAGYFQRCFFARASYGLRLYFYGEELATRLEPALVAWLEAGEHNNVLRGFRLAPAPPDGQPFGSAVGATIAHDHFDRCTRLTLRYELLASQSQPVISRHLYFIATTNDLFARAVEDQAELWDVWQRLRAKLPSSGSLATSDDTDMGSVSAALALAPAFLDAAGTGAALLHDARAANLATAAQLHAAATTNQLGKGRRAWLAAVALGDRNRLGLATDLLDSSIVRVLQLLDPDRAYR